MKQTGRAVAILGMLLVLFGCGSSHESIRDIRTLVQDNRFYMARSSADEKLVSLSFQESLHEKYSRNYFLPWHQERPSCSKKELESEFSKYMEKPGYGENERRHTRDWIQELADNADLETYPNAALNAITLAETNLRVVPTHRPHYYTLKSDGSGYPFDNFQNSLAPPNTPVYVSHFSRDGSWAYVESHCGPGWVPTTAIAFVDEIFISTWENLPQLAILRDRLAVYLENPPSPPLHRGVSRDAHPLRAPSQRDAWDGKNMFVLRGYLGSQFPKEGEEGENYRILVAVSDEDRRARIKRGTVPKDSAAEKPFKLTRSNIARVADELMNQPYGWGGLYENRDCSAMLKDLFAPFDFWLPRHSSDQVLEGSRFISLRHLSPDDKEKTIIEEGDPYLTLIWMPGHIMLYIGTHEDHPLVFHNMWGVRTRDWRGRSQRKVVGHAAITTLHPGIELYNFDPSEGDLLHRVEGMTLMVDRKDRESSEARNR